MKIIKVAALGAITAVAITTAAFAQPANTRPQMPQMTPEQHQQMMANGGMMGRGNMMMSGTDMAQMMEGCHKMMTMMGNKSAEAQKPAPPKRALGN